MGFDEALLYIDKHLTVSGSDLWSLFKCITYIIQMKI